MANCKVPECLQVLLEKKKIKIVFLGGFLSDCVLITLADGRQAVVKNGPSPRAEADMLRAMAGTGAPVPWVLAANDQVDFLKFFG